MKFNLTEIKAACKENNIDPTPILASLKKDRETAEKRPFWSSFLEVFYKFFESVKKNAFQVLKRDWKIFEELYDLLRAKCEKMGYEWTEKMCCLGFEKYLQKAWNKDQWLRNNFTLSNILTQFNTISNESAATKTQSLVESYAENMAARTK